MATKLTVKNMPHISQMKKIPAEKTMPEILKSCRCCGASKFYWKNNFCTLCGRS